MFPMVAKVVNFILMHRFQLEIASLGIGGIAVPYLVAADQLLKIMIGMVTLFLLIRKGYKESKAKDVK